MASRSRLGKGLGALFPALPGEEELEQASMSKRSTQHVSRETPASLSGKKGKGPSERKSAEQGTAATLPGIEGKTPAGTSRGEKPAQASSKGASGTSSAAGKGTAQGGAAAPSTAGEGQTTTAKSPRTARTGVPMPEGLAEVASHVRETSEGESRTSATSAGKGTESGTASTSGTAASESTVTSDVAAGTAAVTGTTATKTTTATTTDKETSGAADASASDASGTTGATTTAGDVAAATTSGNAKDGHTAEDTHATATGTAEPVGTTASTASTGATAPATAGSSSAAPSRKESAAGHGKGRTNAERRARNRRAMPGLDEMAHPSDLFFGGDSGPAMLPKGTSQEPKAIGVSRETDRPADSEEPELKPVQGGYLAELDVTDIEPNAHQPRSVFDEDDLHELSASIKEVGVLQPVVVRRREHRRDGEPGYELIMGERRWRATRMAGLTVIPAIVRTTPDSAMLRDALLENLHRVALNPLEEAAAYQQMIEEFGLTQAQLSKSVSKSRPQIANTLRLLHLPASVQKKVAAGVLSAGHARALLALNSEAEMESLATRIIAEGLSVRSTEEIVAMKNKADDAPRRPKASRMNPWAGSPIQRSLEDHFDTKVSIKGTPKHGRIEIVFSSPEDMNRILSLLVPESDDKPKWV